MNVQEYDSQEISNITEFDFYAHTLDKNYTVMNTIAGSNNILKSLVAWDSGAGATVVNDDQMMWNFKATRIRINGIGPTPVFTDGVGTTIFGSAFLIREAPMSLISQTAMSDNNIEFNFTNDEYTVPAQDNIRTEIIFSRTLERRLYTIEKEKIIRLTQLADQSNSNVIHNIMAAIPSMEYRNEAARLHCAVSAWYHRT